VAASTVAASTVAASTSTVAAAATFCSSIARGRQRGCEN
jgi:hypothetical protein